MAAEAIMGSEQLIAKTRTHVERRSFDLEAELANIDIPITRGGQPSATAVANPWNGPSTNPLDVDESYDSHAQRPQDTKPEAVGAPHDDGTDDDDDLDEMEESKIGTGGENKLAALNDMLKQK